MDMDTTTYDNDTYHKSGQTVYLSESPNPWFKNKQYKRHIEKKNKKNNNLIIIILIIIIIIIAIVFHKN